MIFKGEFQKIACVLVGMVLFFPQKCFGDSATDAQDLIVKIKIGPDREEEFASGTIVRGVGTSIWIVTAKHAIQCCGESPRIQVAFRADPKRFYPVEPERAILKNIDIAVLRVIVPDASKLVPSNFNILSPRNKLDKRRRLQTIGTTDSHSWMPRRIGKFETSENEIFKFTNNVFLEGESGGGVFNSSWQLVGIPISTKHALSIEAVGSAISTEVPKIGGISWRTNWRGRKKRSKIMLISSVAGTILGLVGYELQATAREKKLVAIEKYDSATYGDDFVPLWAEVKDRRTQQTIYTGLALTGSTMAVIGGSYFLFRSGQNHYSWEPKLASTNTGNPELSIALKARF